MPATAVVLSRVQRQSTGSSPAKVRVGFLLLVGLVALVAGGKAVLFDTIDPDCFWHLKVAEQLRAEGVRPVVDRLSFASVQTAWAPYSWLAELGMKATWDAGGYRAAVLVQALIQAALAAAIALACAAARPAASPRCRFLPAPDEGACAGSAPSRLAAVLAAAWAVFLSLPYLSFRPVTAALLLLAVCTWLLVRDRGRGERTRAVWCVIPLTALIVNLHLYAIFVPAWVAMLLAGAVWERWLVALPPERPEADRRVARYFLLLLATGGACLVTPLLPGVVATALHYGTADPMVASSYLSEMRPFFYDGVLGRAAGVLVLAALPFLLGFGLLGKRLRPGEFLWLAGSAIFLSRMGRFAPVFALAAAPMLAVALPRLSDRVLARPPVWGAVAMVLALGGYRLARAFPRADQPMAAWLNRHGPDAPGYPCDAADWVAANVRPRTGRLVNEFTWGGYLEYRLGGRYQVLLDGRTQLFAPEFWRATYLAGPDPRLRFLADVRADAAVVPAGSSVFRHALVQLGWRPVYHDDRAEVLLPPAEQAEAGDRREQDGWSVINALLPINP